MKAISGQFLAFRNILEKSLLEEMCLELKTALKNVLKNVQEAFLSIPKIFQNYLRPFFNVVFNADSESIFSFFLSRLEMEINQKHYDVMPLNIYVDTESFLGRIRE